MPLWIFVGVLFRSCWSCGMKFTMKVACFITFDPRSMLILPIVLYSTVVNWQFKLCARWKLSLCKIWYTMCDFGILQEPLNILRSIWRPSTNEMLSLHSAQGYFSVFQGCAAMQRCFLSIPTKLWFLLQDSSSPVVYMWLDVIFMTKSWIIRGKESHL